MLKKRITEFVGFQVVKFISGFVYMTGLTALIPLLPLVFYPEKLIGAKIALFTAVVMIFLGFLAVYWFSGSKRTALRSLGYMTLLPGFLGVLLLYSPRHMARLLHMFGVVSVFIEEYVQFYVPKAWLLAGVYMILGVVLIWLSYRGKS